MSQTKSEKVSKSVCCYKSIYMLFYRAYPFDGDSFFHLPIIAKVLLYTFIRISNSQTNTTIFAKFAL